MAGRKANCSPLQVWCAALNPILNKCHQVEAIRDVEPTDPPIFKGELYPATFILFCNPYTKKLTRINFSLRYYTNFGFPILPTLPVIFANASPPQIAIYTKLTSSAATAKRMKN